VSTTHDGVTPAGATHHSPGSTPTRWLAFPQGFVWGTATASYQIEGGATEGGRGRSIWDTFSHTPGNVLNGDTGDVACDHYHRWEADLDLMAALRIPTYRFSVAWPRVVPDGSGAVNQAGLDFYDRLVDGLVARGITPLVTLYHWDLPDALQQTGGWVDRSTAYHFARYAEVVAARLGDRVGQFSTLNEPYCTSYLGYASGVHAPGVRDHASAYAAVHHLNLAHGLGSVSIRSAAPDAEVSISLNTAQVYAASDRPEDIAAARHVDGIANRVFLDPMIRGGYPDDVVESTRHLTDWSFVQPGDGALMYAPPDLLGVNFYSPSRICAPPQSGGATRDEDLPRTGRWTNDPSAATRAEPLPWPGTDKAMSVPQPGPYTDMGWRIEPSAFTDLLVRLGHDYPDTPMAVTENGCAYDDGPDGSGRVRDQRRVDYLRDHLAAVHDAIEQGVDIRGYYLWSFLDNFEWALGYEKRFGIVHVDYDTLARTPKDSARWYGDVIAANGLERG
jgi:beta-glucosidase